MIVIIALTEKQAILTDTLNPNPISGRQSIFSRVTLPTETRLTAEIVGVYSTLELANKARAQYAASHPGRKYLQKVAHLDDIATPPPPTTCVYCPTVLTNGQVFCEPCRQTHFQTLRQMDTELPTSPDPIIPATAGQHSVFTS